MILSNADDEAARWLADGLTERGPGAELITADQLCEAARVNHRITAGGVSFRVELDDGRALDSRDVRGVVNRMTHVPAPFLLRVEDTDRAYVDAEWRALVCSLLDAVRGPVIDRPHPYWPAGRWRSAPEWLVLSRRAGLATPAWEWAEVAARFFVDDAADVVSILVIGDDAIPLSPAPAEAVHGCRRLATLAATSVLEVRLLADGRFTFGHADQLPDLRRGGDRALAAIGRVLQP